MAVQTVVNVQTVEAVRTAVDVESCVAVQTVVNVPTVEAVRTAVDVESCVACKSDNPLSLVLDYGCLFQRSSDFASTDK